MVRDEKALKQLGIKGTCSQHYTKWEETESIFSVPGIRRSYPFSPLALTLKVLNLEEKEKDTKIKGGRTQIIMCYLLFSDRLKVHSRFYVTENLVTNKFSHKSNLVTNKKFFERQTK